jgi:hypothetical protein
MDNRLKFLGPNKFLVNNTVKNINEKWQVVAIEQCSGILNTEGHLR